MKEFGIFAHGYQPPREVGLPWSGGRLNMCSSVNDRIFRECYEPLLVRQPMPEGVFFSFYAPLRDWIRGHNPDAFRSIVENLHQTKDIENRLMGDPYIHSIMPLDSPEDQDMMVKIGRQALYDDLGIVPKSFWLPESAVSTPTLQLLYQNNYQRVVLRNDQLKRSDSNPMYISLGNSPSPAEMEIIHYDGSLSGKVSYQPGLTDQAESFLSHPEFSNRAGYYIGTDLEFYGHHHPGKDQLLLYITNSKLLDRYGFQPFTTNPRRESKDKAYTEIWNNSSWSCPHNLGRWTGECECDLETMENPDARTTVLKEKRDLYLTASSYGERLNQRLDYFIPSWRSEVFPQVFLGLRDAIFVKGNIDDAIEQQIVRGNPSFDLLKDGTMRNLLLAKYMERILRTSCIWFFGGLNRLERQLGHAMIQEIELLVPDIREAKIEQEVSKAA